ncbi:hypothetical protein B0H14DRAFT_2656658 [Mycena olivaceomarginata]|nr:hypothetical protein B0H14DRAFT_2656658 [Mycena olivaceomarginata]
MPGRHLSIESKVCTGHFWREKVNEGIFESAQIKAEIGAAIVVPVNAQCVLEHLRYEKENLLSVDFVAVETFNAAQGGESRSGPWGKIDGKGVTTALMCLRSDLHAELERLATGPGVDPPAVIRLSSQIVDCNPDEGSLTLSDGSVVQSDVVLGADGISIFLWSIMRTHVLGYEQKSVRSLTTFRTLLNMAALDALPELTWLRQGASGSRNIIEFGNKFRDPHQADPGWEPSGTREDLLAEFMDYLTQSQALFTMLPERLPRWQLCFLPTLSTWPSAKAPPNPSKTPADSRSSSQLAPRAQTYPRLKVFEGLRKERGELITRESHDQMMVPSERGKYVQDPELQKVVMGYNVLDGARKVYAEQFGGGGI